jgi:hypothetical protein
MFILLLSILGLSLLGFIACVTLRGPLIRAAQDRHGLQTGHASITAARARRLAEHSRSTDLDVKMKQRREQLAKGEVELAKTEQSLANLPKQVFEVLFELGAPDGALECYEFTVGRRPALQRASELQGPEAELWARPRRLRAWATNQTAAMAMAQSRFSSVDGFFLRMADTAIKPVAPALTSH